MEWVGPETAEREPDVECASAFDRAQVEAVLDRLRPYIRQHGGDIELVSIEGADVRVVLRGTCVGCPSSTLTLTYGVEKELRAELPGFGELLTDRPAESRDTRPRWWQKLLDR